MFQTLFCLYFKKSVRSEGKMEEQKPSNLSSLSTESVNAGLIILRDTERDCEGLDRIVQCFDVGGAPYNLTFTDDHQPEAAREGHKELFSMVHY